MNYLIVLRGGGDIASGVALRLYRAGFQVVILELEKPLAVRRTVSFSEAVYEETQTIEGVKGRLVSTDQYQVTIDAGEIPVVVDPQANILRNPLLISPRSTIVVDARLLKKTPEPLESDVPLHIGLGPGFSAGENCSAAVETRRGHTLGRVYWNGSTLPDSGEPEGDRRRVLRAPNDGVLTTLLKIGDPVDEGQLIAEIESEDKGDVFPIISPFKGILRGLIRPGLRVTKGLKVGDIDRRQDPSMYTLVSDKALAVGGGVMEAVLTFLGKDGRLE